MELPDGERRRAEQQAGEVADTKLARALTDGRAFASLAEQALRLGDHARCGDAELLEEDLCGRGGAEAVERHEATVCADVAVPALTEASFHDDAGRHGA